MKRNAHKNVKSDVFFSDLCNNKSKKEKGEEKTCI